MAYITKDGKIIRGDTEKPSTRFDMNKIHEIAEKLKKEIPPKLTGFKGEREPPDCLLLTLITSGCIIMLDP